MSSAGCFRAWCFRAWCCALVLCAHVLGAGCARGEVRPEVLAVGQEACAFCRMTVSQPEFASQLLVEGELPKFFDDLGCLHSYLTAAAPGPRVVSSSSLTIARASGCGPTRRSTAGHPPLRRPWPRIWWRTQRTTRRRRTPTCPRPFQ